MSSEVVVSSGMERVTAIANSAMAQAHDFWFALVAGWNSTPTNIQITFMVTTGILVVLTIRYLRKARASRREERRLRGLLEARGAREMIPDDNWE